VAVTGSPVTLTGTGLAVPTKPTLNVLDTFNRANATTLGANWSQLSILGSAALRVNTNVAFANSAGNAYWNVPPAGFLATQSAAMTITNTTLIGDSLLLKVSGTPVLLGVAPNFIRVQLQAAQVVVETTTTYGLTTTQTGVLPATFANGDTLTATANADGSVDVWKTTAANVTTFIGRSAAVATFNGTGRIGIQLPQNARVDSFAGG
jgi:hypothetical protein